MRKTNRNKAFSLIELSIVILVVGILIAGITQGSSLYQKFRLQTARNLTQNSPVSGIKDLVLWLDATSEKSFVNGANIKTTDPIAIWYDISTQKPIKNDATQNSSGNQPRYVEYGINDLPSVSFDGSNDFLNLADNSAMDNPNTIFLVVQLQNAASSDRALIGKAATSTASGTYYIRYEGSGGTSFKVRPVVVFDSSAPTVFPGIFDMSAMKPNLITSSYEENKTMRVWIDLRLNPASSSISGALTNISDPIRIGGAAPSGQSIGQAFNGYISEIISYNRYLTTEERQAVEKYLSKKYNIPLLY